MVVVRIGARIGGSTRSFAKVEVPKGRNPGGFRVLLANPRLERRFAKFFDLSGVGRMMADQTDEESARGGKMNKLMVWEAEKRVAPRGQFAYLSFFSSYFFCSGR
jgi:hypothetical protein